VTPVTLLKAHAVSRMAGRVAVFCTKCCLIYPMTRVSAVAVGGRADRSNLEKLA
jgi:hypothetical protein